MRTYRPQGPSTPLQMAGFPALSWLNSDPGYESALHPASNARWGLGSSNWLPQPLQDPRPLLCSLHPPASTPGQATSPGPFNTRAAGPACLSWSPVYPVSPERQNNPLPEAGASETVKPRSDALPHPWPSGKSEQFRYFSKSPSPHLGASPGAHWDWER